MITIKKGRMYKCIGKTKSNGITRGSTITEGRYYPIEIEGLIVKVLQTNKGKVDYYNIASFDYDDYKEE